MQAKVKFHNLIFISILLLFSFNTYSQNLNLASEENEITENIPQNYLNIVGIYKLYKDGSPVFTSKMYIYYLLNKNGVALMAMGKSSNIAFYDVSGGIKSGRIIAGKFEMTLNTLALTMGKGETTNWVYNSSIKELKKGNMKLVFVENLE